MAEWKAECKAEESEYREPPCAENKRARDKGLYYLQFSAKTEEEMRVKLARDGFSPGAVSDAVGFLREYRYLNDEDYARRYVERNGNRKSRRRISYDLRLKGIPADIVDAVLADMPVDEESQILSILEKKGFAVLKDDAGERAKISAYLARKGFSYDDVSSAMEKFAP